HGLVFIGPPPDVLARFHDKAATRIAMKQIGVPVIPGSDGSVRNAAEALRIAEAIGYPVMLKAKAGGGGRGMRKATSPSEVQRLWPQAQAEAKASFGDDGIYIERCLEGVRHVEAQVALAQGELLSFSEEQIWVQGHAIECRINAEDAEANFAPSTGVLTSWLPPGGPASASIRIASRATRCRRTTTRCSRKSLRGG